MVQKSLFLSPLRYPGSKRRLVRYIENVLELNSLSPKLYIEPFVGGASVAINLLLENKVDQAILMDIDPYIANFWEIIFFDTEWLIDQIESIDVSLEKWHKFKKQNPQTKREYALACLFLNRTSFSGIIRNEIGPLGGRDQKSEYKIDCRFPRKTLIKRIRKISEKRESIFGIWDCSWEIGINRIMKLQKSGELPTEDLFLYFDPPFFERANKLYRHYFHADDHIKLRDVLIEMQDPWVLSYDAANQVESLYGKALRNRKNGAKRKNIDIYYSLAQLSERRVAKEVIISNLPKLPT